MADSRHNKYVSVTDWFKPAPGSTTSGTVSGSTGAATSGASFVGGSWGSGGGGGGLTITIIKTNDTTPESNSNVYSALRVHNSFIAKDKDERTEGKLSSDVGFEVGEFVSGVSGAICYVDPETLQTTAELDRLKVRVKAYFETLEIVNVNSVGGKQIISPAGSINCIRVDEHGGTIDILKERQATDEEGNPLYDINGNPIMETYIESVDNGVPEDTYRCYFLAELDGETIENRFHVGDQAYSQMFDAQPGISSNVSSKYYWRLVTGISYDPIEIAGKKYHYIDLSVSDCDTDSDAPSVGDIICHRGHRTLPGDIEGRDRQNALEFSAVDTFSPSITLYQGIGESDPDNGKYPYSLVGKDIIQYGVNRLNNRAFMNVYGDMYVGDRDGQSYLQFDETAGLTVKGNIQFGSKSKMEGDDLTLEERIELASKAYEEDVNQFKAAVEKSFSDVQNQIDGAIETYFLDPEPTLENEPAIDWNTDLIKAAHVGDLYYSKQGNAYRFQYDEITDDDGSKHNLYYWNLIKDTDITLALANAQKAQDTADSKRKIFVKQPSTNDSYEEGDMWANATYPATGVPKYSNDLLRAVTSKQAGEPFNINHWVLSSKYTDDTAAIAAQEAADEAQRAANNAQSDATAAANRLSSWAADNVISPTEKQGIKEEYVRVIKDKDSIHELWDYYFLDTTGSTEIGKIYIAYNNAYLPYVEQLIYLFTAKDSDGVALENIPIPDNFDDNQTAYYSNRAIALNTIAAAAKKVADDAQAAADNAYEEAEKALTAAEEAKTSVYGLNTTVTGLKDFTDDAFLDGIINSSERKTIENYIYQINTVLAQVQQSYSEVVDNTFLVESVAKTNLENSYNSFITATNELLQTVNVISNQGSVENIDRAGFEVKYNNFNSKYSDYTKYLNAAIKFIEYAINSRVDTTLQELGGYSYLKNAFNEETTVTGGLVLTSLVALGYTDDNQQYHVMGGINGSHANNDGIAIWAGGSAVDRAIEPNNPNAADFLVRMDGTGYAAGGNFWWESDGTIHADPLSFVISESSVGALLSSLKVYYNVTNSKPSPYALEPLVPFTKLTIASDIELNSNARISFGDVYLAYDNVNNSVYIANQNGSPVNFYISGGISMYSANSMASTSIMDIVAQNIDTNTLRINDQGLLTVIGGGTGGGGSIDYPLSWSGFSSGSFDGSAAKTIYIPSKLSELTNDSGYALSSALSGYLPLSGGKLTGSVANVLSIDSGDYQDSNGRSAVINFYGGGERGMQIGFTTTTGVYMYKQSGYFLGIDNNNAPYFGTSQFHYTFWHEGNFNPSDYLPKSGGEINGNLGFGVDIASANTIGNQTRLPSHIFRNVFDNGGNVYDHYYNPSYNATENTFAHLRVLSSTNGIRALRFGGDGSFTWDYKTVLHEGNYSSYALPLSGNTLNSAITGHIYFAYQKSVAFAASNGTVQGSYGMSDSFNPLWWNGNGTHEILHSSNYSSYALPLVGGNIGDGTKGTPLILTGNQTIVELLLKSSNGTQKGSCVWQEGYGVFIYNYTSGGLLGIKDDGTPVYGNNTLIHSGNIGSQMFVAGSGGGGLAYIGGDGVMEVSSIIDFHSNNSDGNDFNTRLYSTGSYKNQVQLPTSSGTLALTTDNVASATNADKVDGYHAAGIFTYEGETYVNGESSLWNSLGTKVYAGALPDGLTDAYTYGQTISFGIGNAKFDMYVSHISTSLNYDNSGGGIYVRSGWQSDRLNWRRLAYIDSNVASATKLQTARTIWGQSFDGTGNVRGSLYLDNQTFIYSKNTGGSNKWLIGLSNDNTLYIGGETTAAGYNTYLEGYNIYFRSGNRLNNMIINSSGNVGIGTTNPAYKLDVSGDIHNTTNIFSNGAFLAASGSEGAYLHGTGISWHNSSNIWVKDLFTYSSSSDILTVHKGLRCYSNLTVDGATTLSSTLYVSGIATFGSSLSTGGEMSAMSRITINGSATRGSYPNIMLHIPGYTYAQFCINEGGTTELRVGNSQSGVFMPLSVGSFTSNGNILCTGSITMNSMRSMKNVINEKGLSLEELSTIKPTRFTWKDGRDDRIHVGGIADDVMKVLPEVIFKGSDGVLSMDYASAAFVMAASLIQPMTEHERRIANLERENALLKEEIRNLKSA